MLEDAEEVRGGERQAETSEAWRQIDFQPQSVDPQAGPPVAEGQLDMHPLVNVSVR